MDEKTTELLNQLAIKLGTTAEHLWKVLVVEARISIWGELASTFFMSFFIFILYKLHRNFPNWWRDDYGVTPPALIAGIVIGIYLLVYFFALASFVESLPTRLYNPEYYALKEVLKIIK